MILGLDLSRAPVHLAQCAHTASRILPRILFQMRWSPLWLRWLVMTLRERCLWCRCMNSFELAVGHCSKRACMARPLGHWDPWGSFGISPMRNSFVLVNPMRIDWKQHVMTGLDWIKGGLPPLRALAAGHIFLEALWSRIEFFTVLANVF